jgi:nitroimidazol reductase NimA-like FMN-containing flavoprotein (pyridoxamine 5'-phosphate oxidase superfamily)
MQTDAITSTLKGLFASQRFAVLATTIQEAPHCSLMAFTATEDLHYLVVATKRDTRKFNHIRANPNVAFLIDNRTNTGADIETAVAVTVYGIAEEVRGKHRRRYLEPYLARHPYMADFATSPSCALVIVEVETYLIVHQLGNVTVWQPG